jgi:hypothetical protein
MNNNNISLSPLLSKELMQLGYPQKGYDATFMIIKDYGGQEYIVDNGTRDEYGYEIVCDCPTVSEILDNMIDCIIENDNHYNLTIIKVKDNYWVAYNCEGISALISFDGNSLVECLGNLWVWCKEKGYKQGDINEK